MFGESLVYRQAHGVSRVEVLLMVVDCDSHIMEPADLWTHYLEAEYVDRAIRIEQTDAGEQLIIAEQVV